MALSLEGRSSVSELGVRGRGRRERGERVPFREGISAKDRRYQEPGAIQNGWHTAGRRGLGVGGRGISRTKGRLGLGCLGCLMRISLNVIQ